MCCKISLNSMIGLVMSSVNPSNIPQNYRHLAVPTVAAVQTKSKSSSNEIKANKRASQS